MTENIRSSKEYKNLTPYDACANVEGFADHDVTQEEAQASWQYLLDTGQCWTLQGWYGRTVTQLLEDGLLLPPKEDRVDHYGNVVPGTK